MDKIESKLRADIEQYGWHVVNVLAEKKRPPHTYSIGLFATFEHPEIVVVGLPADTAQRLINNIADEIRDGNVFEAGTAYDDILTGYDVTFVSVAPKHYAAHFGRAIDYYGSEAFPVFQLIWPDRNHAFPWDPECDPAIRNLQPVLGEAKGVDQRA
jgi:hypothetical protein